MNRVRFPLLSDIYSEQGFWKIHCLEAAADKPDLRATEQWRAEQPIGPAAGPGRLTKREAQRIAWNNYLATLRHVEPAVQSGITVARFVETAFVPEHVQGKRLAGRAFYQAMLKHVILPEEVDRIFQVSLEKSNGKLRAIPDWPYLGDLRLQECKPQHVERLISAAIARGYSSQTVVHIRNVVSAIFSHAKKARRLAHDNPAKLAVLPERPKRAHHLLTLVEVMDVLRAMRYPEKEMTLIAILTSMNVAEICGLQWKHVNLTGAWSDAEGEPIQPITIVVRKLWYRGELDTVSGARARHIPIPELLLPVLIRLSGRERFTGPDDFVLVSRAGTPVNAINITARRLRAIGNQLEMPWLTWNAFRRGRLALEGEFGAQFYFQLAGILRSGPP